MLRADWERKLAKYGLSEMQLRQAGLQIVSGPARPSFQDFQFDPELARHWKTQAMRYVPVSASELSGWFGRVPTRTYETNRPSWAFNDKACRAVLLAMYPGLTYDVNDKVLRKRYGAEYLKKCMAGTRRRAARQWFAMYFCWRLDYTAPEVADMLGVKPDRVYTALDKARERGDALFNANPAPTKPKARSARPKTPAPQPGCGYTLEPVPVGA